VPRHLTLARFTDVGLAEVSRFPAAYLSVAEVVEQWEVSVRTLRRRLAAGAPGAYQDKTGQWILSAQWVDSEFHRRKTAKPRSEAEAEPSEPTDNAGDDPAEVTIDLSDSSQPHASGPPEAWIKELVEAERRATRAETQLELAQTQIDDLRSDLHGAKADLDYERALVNRLKDQLRGNQ
jgi:hypothetical protein